MDDLNAADDSIPIVRPVRPQATWGGLALYFITAIGLALVLGIPLGVLISKGFFNSGFLKAVLMLLTTASVFLGAAYFGGILRGQFTLQQIGFRPAKITWK